ncbi:DUF4366 domain-containing protein [Oribacterium sp. WCC10]|uniref:DUF4366 domain-containing protein n=1 Tax=Oribacterium sp. WCC10 TaxID=1855343 RepID=UPI0008E65981|nr:DUF4366 domain-containing protein [Oribacterium sp. WCC10]SFG20826.1 hypothetical protein SAMN05216356_103149 [Oribacterium sp. WCC10]
MDKFDILSLFDNAKDFKNCVKTHREDAKERAELLLQKLKLQDYLEQKKEDEKLKKTLLTILAIIGIIASVAAIAYAVYRFVAPDYLEDYDDYEDPEEDGEIAED